jgi:uncharacterized protein YbdZ (MbtH family)
MFDDEEMVFKVVRNEEEQYSIWPQDRENPLGWYDEGKAGLKQECLDHIEKVWTDMRPLRLRKHMEELQERGDHAPENSLDEHSGESDLEPVEDLVTRLSRGRHHVSVERYKTFTAFREAIENGFVLVRFTQTRGGTELGFRIDRQESLFDPTKFSSTRLVGRFTLDDARVECHVEIEGDQLEGVGYLTRLDPELTVQ